MINIEAVTVCVGYADFLSEAVQFNTNVLDRWVVVTTEEDEATREICRRNNLQVLLSSDHTRDGAGQAGSFNKGRLVDRGLQHLSSGSWRIHMDADIVLPHEFRNLVQGAALNTRKIYGCDRVMFKSYEDWKAHKASGWQGYTYNSLNTPRGFDLGTRWGGKETGYVPIGYFQMWHSDADEWRGSRIRKYPISHGTACRTDVQFALQWDRKDRELLGEFVVAHLESEPAKLGANWQGRVTKQFGPVNPFPKNVTNMT